MKTFLKWAVVVILVVAIGAFLAFLYFIPPFLSAAPETFSKPEHDAAPDMSAIADPAERAIAEHGKYIVVRTGCIGCHQTPGPEGPRWDMYLAGGGKNVYKDKGTWVTRNLTPDDTGLGKVTDEQIKRVLRSGVFRDGRPVFHRDMPWDFFSNLTLSSTVGSEAWNSRDLKSRPH